MKIKGKDIIKHSGGFKPPAFRIGRHATVKDKPRKKIKPRDYRKEDY